MYMLTLGLCACGSSAPAPATAPAPKAQAAEPVPPAAPKAAVSTESTEPAQKSAPAQTRTPAQAEAFAVQPLPDTLPACHPSHIPSFDFRRLHHCCDSLAQAGRFDEAIALLQLQVDARNNPAQLGRRTLQLARYLDAQGRSREAAKVLEDYLVYKPAVGEWMDSAEALEAQFQLARDAKKNAFAPLVKQIRNLGAAGADYGQVRLLTDSLRSLQPGDSLLSWSKAQDELALQRSLNAIQKKKAEVKTLVNDRADFPDAIKIADALLAKYPELSDTTGLNTLRRWIDEQQKLYANDADAAYWSGRDARDSLKEARALLERKQYAQSASLYRKLLASPLRKEAREDLEILSDSYCEEQRKIAAERFASARRAPKSAAAYLDEAIAALDRCLQDYPEAPVAEKVRQNRTLLVNEKAKLGEKP